jgi:hypothetical protein
MSTGRRREEYAENMKYGEINDPKQTELQVLSLFYTQLTDLNYILNPGFNAMKTSLAAESSA